MLLGFDALGRYGLLQFPSTGAAALVADTGSFALSGKAASFAISQISAVGSIALTGVSASFVVSEIAGKGAFAHTGIAAAFAISEAATVGAFTLNGQAATFAISVPEGVGAFAFSGIAATFNPAINGATGTYALTGNAANEPIVADADPGEFRFTFPEARLERTGFDYEVQQGGIGHYLLAIEEAKRLAKITRKVPAPIDRRTMPRFEPLRASPIAPAAPAVDMAAIQNQRMAEAAAAVAAATKRRRDLEAILLLAS